MPRVYLFLISIMLCGTTTLARNTVPALTKGRRVVPLNLSHAVAIGDRAAVMRLLANGADAKAKNADNKLPFEIAIDMNHNALVAILLKAAAGIDGLDEKGWTPLNWAVLSDDWSLVKELLSEGANIFAGHQNALDVAVMMQSEAELMQAFITANNIDIVVSNKQATNIVHLLVHGVKINNNGEITADIAATKKDYALAAIILKAADGINGYDNKGWKPLLWAVLSEDWQLVQQLLSESTYPFAGYPYPHSALDIAVLMQNEVELMQAFITANNIDIAVNAQQAKIITHLLVHGVKINDRGEIIADVAATKKEYTLAAIILKAAEGVNGKDNNAWTPLHWAVLSEDWQLVQQLISEGANALMKYWYSAMDIALKMQSEAELIQALITANNIDIAVSTQQAANIVHLLVHGVEINDSGEIVAAIATTKQDYALAAIMLKAVSGIKVHDKNGWIPLLWAVLSEDWQLVRQLISEDANIFLGFPYSAVSVAVQVQSEVELIQAFITANNIDIEISTEQATNIVHLLMHGVEISDNGEIVTDIDVPKKDYALAAIMLKTAVGINSRDENGWTPLHWAVFSEDWQLVRQLLSEGANMLAGYPQNIIDSLVLMQQEAKFIKMITVIGTPSNYGETILIYAARQEYAKAVKMLLEGGVNPNVKGSSGEIALIHATREEKTEIVELLLKHGANPNIKDTNGNTALMHAAYYGYTKLVKYLLTEGADHNLVNNNNETALDIASKRQHQEIIALLNAA